MAVCRLFAEFVMGRPRLVNTSFHTDASLNAKLGCGVGVVKNGGLSNGMKNS